MVSHSRAKHAAAHVPGYIMDIGTQRVRSVSTRPKYGKRGVWGHRGAREVAIAATARAWKRALMGAYPYGLHGVTGD